jgi:hypothetical protein
MAKISDEPESNPKMQRELADLVDQAGLRNVLFMLGAICSAKARTHTQHRETALAFRWQEASRDLLRAARRVRVLR